MKDFLLDVSPVNDSGSESHFIISRIQSCRNHLTNKPFLTDSFYLRNDLVGEKVAFTTMEVIFNAI